MITSNEKEKSFSYFFNLPCHALKDHCNASELRIRGLIVRFHTDLAFVFLCDGFRQDSSIGSAVTWQPQTKPEPRRVCQSSPNLGDLRAIRQLAWCLRVHLILLQVTNSLKNVKVEVIGEVLHTSVLFLSTRECDVGGPYVYTPLPLRFRDGAQYGPAYDPHTVPYFYRAVVER